MKRRTRLARAIVLAAAVLLGALGSHAPARADLIHAADRAGQAITAMDFDEARRILDLGDPNDPAVALQSARLALHEERCDDAVSLLARPLLAHSEGAQELADIARGCARVTAATVVDRDDARGVEVRYQDEDDRVLGPLLVETVEKARATLERDLGVTWPRPTRVVVVRDLLSLAAMTGLPYASAKTTGTVAVAKWGRVTLLSPRAPRHAYSWRDTIAHELTHLAVTRLTVDRAPLWLQEGIAKREETRWREPKPFDDRPSPEAVVLRGMAVHDDTPLDKLGPSIAMLASADKAAVAFAEVTSFVRFYADSVGAQALPKLLASIRDRDDANAALKALTGTDLAGWDTKWRAFLAGRPPEAIPPGAGPGGPPPPGARDARDRARLAELLLARNHASSAVTQLAALPADVWADPSLRHLRARAMEAAGDLEGAEASVGEPADVIASYGPWWAIRGRFARARVENDQADAFFLEAISQDPLDVEVACESIDPAYFPAFATSRALCEAARKRGEPPFGGD
jgi:hypothetical protein